MSSTPAEATKGGDHNEAKNPHEDALKKLSPFPSIEPLSDQQHRSRVSRHVQAQFYDLSTPALPDFEATKGDHNESSAAATDVPTPAPVTIAADKTTITNTNNEEDKSTNDDDNDDSPVMVESAASIADEKSTIEPSPPPSSSLTTPSTTTAATVPETTTTTTETSSDKIVATDAVVPPSSSSSSSTSSSSSSAVNDTADRFPCRRITPPVVDNIMPFPMFACSWAMNNKVLVCGGGGTKGTGVKSGIFVCDVVAGQGHAHGGAKVAAPFELCRTTQIDTNNNVVAAVAIHPLRDQLAFAIGPDTCIFDLVDDRLEFKASVKTDFEPDEVKSYQSVVAYSHSGALIASGGEDRCIRLWSSSTLQPHTLVGREGDSVNSLAFNHDDTLIASCSGVPRCSIWRVSTEVSDFQADQRLVDEDSKAEIAEKAASGVKKPLAMVRDPKKLIQHTLTHDGMAFARCVFIQLPTKRGKSTPSDGKSKKDDSNTTRTTDTKANSGDDRERFITLNNGGQRGPGYVLLWHPQQWRLIKKVKVSPSPLVWVEASHDGSMITVVDSLNHIYILRTDTLGLIRRRLDCHGLATTGCAFAPDDGHVLSVAADWSCSFTSTAAIGACGGNFIRVAFNLLLVCIIAYFVTFGFSAVRSV